MEHTALEELDTCPICAAEHLTKVMDVKDHSVSGTVFSIQECGSCGLRMTNPRPGPNAIGKYYASDDYISHTNSSKGILNKVYQLVRNRALSNKHELLRSIRPNGKVLDIGCGTGQFLAYLASRGYQVSGVEPELKARELAIADHALSVLPSLDRIPAQEQFHFVTLWHVMEHLHDLRQTLKQIYARSASNAVVIIAVPDRESWDAQHYGPEWAAYDVPRHLWHFRRADLSRLLQEHGFELLRTRPMWYDAIYVSLLSEKYRGTGSFMAWLRGGAIGMLSNLISAFGKRPTSSTLYIAKKVEA